MSTPALSLVRPRTGLRRVARSAVCAAALLVSFACQPAVSGSACKVAQVAEFHVTMSEGYAYVHTLINGADADFIADTGAFFSSLTPAAAQQYKLPLHMAPWGMYVSGVGGGTSDVSIATVKEFTLLGVKLPRVEFLVAGNDFGSAVGLLGQNLFRLGDSEFDLANGAIRILKPGDGCGSIGLAYWTKGGAYSQIPIERQDDRAPHILGYVYLNGVRIKAMFDTGAGRTVVSLEGAKKAGITPTSPGVKTAGASYGIGHHYVQRWIAPFHSFKIGDEEIRDFNLYVGDIGAMPSDAQMLVGPDFFLSHRVLVASNQAKLYFTYNGGPVFNLGIRSKDEQAPNESVAAASGAAVAASQDPADAAAFSRRAGIAMERHDFPSAIADLDKACELAPEDSGYRYQRAMAHWDNHQSDLALADLDSAIKLQPGNVRALLARAELRIESDPQAAVADLEAADRILPKESVDHLEIGNRYQQANQLPAAVVQYTKWIDSHEHGDVHMPRALNSRCWARALMNEQLPAALADCNDAVKLAPQSAGYLDSRGLVYLRMADNTKAIADYNAALAINPKLASALYCRGIAKSNQGHLSEGHADITAATALAPKVAELYTKYNVVPWH